MSNLAIRVESLSKRFQITHQSDSRDGLKHTLDQALRNPLRWLSGRKEQKKRAKEEFWALRDVSFEVAQGEVVGIIGRNGAGKSTLLKILSRITEPTSGRIEINGRVASLLEVGTGFHPELTGRENIFLNGAILGMTHSEIKRKYDEIVAFSGVERFLDTPVKRYSSGMHVRLAFAVAAHLEPEILIVDEVLAVGDSSFQRKCIGKMNAVAKGGRTVLFVSHSMAAVQELCSRALLFREGRIHLDDSTDRVTTEYYGDGSVGNNGSFDLRDHPSRSRSHKQIIEKLTLRGAEAGLTNCVFTDEEVEVELAVKVTNEIPDPRMAIAIEDSAGRRIMTMASYFGPTKLPALSGSCKVVACLGKLGLGPGRYLFSVSIGDKANGLLDSLDGVAWFDVEWRNVFGNGEPYFSSYGPVLKGSSWRILDSIHPRREVERDALLKNE